MKHFVASTLGNFMYSAAWAFRITKQTAHPNSRATNILPRCSSVQIDRDALLTNKHETLETLRDKWECDAREVPQTLHTLLNQGRKSSEDITRSIAKSSQLCVHPSSTHTCTDNHRTNIRKKDRPQQIGNRCLARDPHCKQLMAPQLPRPKRKYSITELERDRLIARICSDHTRCCRGPSLPSRCTTRMCHTSNGHFVIPYHRRCDACSHIACRELQLRSSQPSPSFSATPCIVHNSPHRPQMGAPCSDRSHCHRGASHPWKYTIGLCHTSNGHFEIPYHRRWYFCSHIGNPQLQR